MQTLLIWLMTSMFATADMVVDTTLHLHEVVVHAASHNHTSTENSLSSVEVPRQVLHEQVAPSLSSALTAIAGVQASSVGSGQSRPMIRGLGFNRIAVLHDGIRHEGQQWGDDHGLEIDRFALDRVAVIKGPAALLYGSDAIGGVLLLSSSMRPTRPLTGSVQLFARSNNLLGGGSLRLEGINKGFFWRLNGTYQDYADFAVPTDHVDYYSYRIPLYKNRLRNTAGREADGSLTLGYAAYRWHTCVKVFESYLHGGMFANAHGLEVRLSDIDYDRSNRDIDLPYQWVNHLKVLFHTVYIGEQWSLELNAAWQHNLRREHSEPVAHGYMPTPDSDLERSFSKHTATLNAIARWQLNERHTLRFGLNGEGQFNRRAGWGFILPDFENYTAGLYAAEQWTINQQLTLNAGLRYDYTRLTVHAYRDWFATPVRQANGTSVNEYVQRSHEAERNFHSFTYSAGLTYTEGNWLLKANLGKAFRAPTAKETAANGINYHIFRFEQGNPSLSPEQSYQADMTIGWENSRWVVHIEPFANYFPNYIYLSPTSGYREGLQVYQYQEAQVFRTGFEAQVILTPWQHMDIALQADYLFARQLSGTHKGYGLPFSPPWRLMPELRFRWTEGYAAVNVRVAGTQHDIVPPEKPTDGWWTLNLRAGQQVTLFASDSMTTDAAPVVMSVSLTADNILNRRYMDHTSYYRFIDVPEPGWNVSLMVGLTF